MDKKKIRIQCLLLLLFMLLGMYTHSQNLFTKELQWKTCDSIMIFQDKNQIIEWSKSIDAFVQLEEFCVKNSNIIILTTDICSGVFCLSIEIFIEKNQHWRLILSTSARLREIITLKVEDSEEKIIFEIKSGKIGELPFEVLLSSE